MINIAYVAGFDFEAGSAGRNRMQNVFRAFIPKGNNKIILTTIPSISSNFDKETYEIWPLKNKEKNVLFNFLIIFKLFYYIIKNRKIFNVYILYGGYSLFMLPFILLRPFIGYKVMYDSVEIYYNEKSLRTILSVTYINKYFGYNFFIRFLDGAICISKTIQKKHQKQGLKTIVVPPILFNNYPGLIKEKEIVPTKKSIIYYGSPGTKDLLNNLIQAFIDEKDLAESFTLKLMGMSLSDLTSYCKKNGINGLPTNLVMIESKPIEGVLTELRNSDFSFIQRPYLISTQAGFPSKLVECLYIGTPLILNITSDMDLYEVSKASILCFDDSIASLKSALERARHLTESEYINLVDNCHYIYKIYFEVKIYESIIFDFITNIQND